MQEESSCTNVSCVLKWAFPSSMYELSVHIHFGEKKEMMIRVGHEVGMRWV